MTETKTKILTKTKLAILVGITAASLAGLMAAGVIAPQLSKASIRATSDNAKKLDYDNNKKIDTKDVDFLVDVLMRKNTCPAGKVCDVNQDSSFSIADVVRLVNIVLGKQPIPNFSPVVKGGKVTFALAPFAPASYVNNITDDTRMFDFYVNSEADIAINKLKFYICWNRAAGSEAMANVGDMLKDIKLIDANTKAAVMGPTDGANWIQENDGAFTPSGCSENVYEGQMYYTFANDYTGTGFLNIDANMIKELQLTMDIQDGDSKYIDIDDYFTVVMENPGELEKAIRYRASSDFVPSSAILPGADIIGNNMTIQPSDLTIRVDQNTPQSAYVAMGASDTLFSKFRFTASIEPFIVNTLTISADVGSVMKSADIKCVKVSYPKKDGSIGTSSCLNLDSATNSVKFNDLSLYVPANSYAYLDVKADIKSYAEGAISNVIVSFNFDGDASFRATGQESGVSITESHANIVDVNGNYMEIQRSYPKFELISLGGGSRSSIPTTLMKFRVTAMGEDVAFSNAFNNAMKFRVVASGQDGGDITLALYDDETGVWLDDEEKSDEGGVWVGRAVEHASASFDFDQQSATIVKGQTKTFRVDITSGKSVFNENGDFIQLIMPKEFDAFIWDNGDVASGHAVFYNSTTSNAGIPLTGDKWIIQGL